MSRGLFAAAVLALALTSCRSDPPAQPPALGQARAALRPPVDSVADVILGQAVFTEGRPNLADSAGLDTPHGVAVDRSGGGSRIYVADSGNNRVLMWRTLTSLADGKPADLVIGQPDFFTTGNLPTGACLDPSPETLCQPKGLAVDASGNLYVADKGNNRVLAFDTPDAAGGDAVPDRVYGQSSFSAKVCSAVSAATLCGPTSVALDGTGRLFVADAQRARVLRFDAPRTSSTASAVFGQATFGSAGPNGVDAKGIRSPLGVVYDRARDRLYVADSDNHRVLAWSGVGALANGAPAALVLGQPDANAAVCNNGGRSASTLCYPRGLAVDGAGNLFVADSRNHRVLEYDDPFAGGAAGLVADRVFGQTSFTTANCPTTISATNMCSPTAVAWSAVTGDLAVVEADRNRVRLFRNPLDADLVAARLADFVFGQRGSFGSSTANKGGLDAEALDNPRCAAFDASGSLYVCDDDNNRVLRYDAPSAAPFTWDTAADFVYGQPGFTSSGCPTTSAASVCSPSDVTVDAQSRVWIAETRYRVLGYVGGSATATLVLGRTSFNSGGAVSYDHRVEIGARLASDASGNVFVADFKLNRVLRFPPPYSYTSSAPAAPDLVLGQAGYQEVQPNFADAAGVGTLLTLAVHDATGRLYVGDAANHRVLWVPAGFGAGAAAGGVFGQADAFGLRCNQGAAAPTASSLCQPTGLALTVAGDLFVADTGNNRVLRFAASPADALADAVLGQATMLTATCDAAGLSASSLCAPNGLAVDGATLFVADGAHHRVVRVPTAFASGAGVDLALGQAARDAAGVNSADARSLNEPSDVVFDRSVTPNRVYVADRVNARVLGFASAASLADAAPADLVLGRPDATHTGCTAPESATVLCRPAGLLVLANGDLLVADAGHHRVVRFNQPFTTDLVADDVWGKTSLTDTGNGCTAASATRLCGPRGLALSPTGDLFVADHDNHRVLAFAGMAKTATLVLGQADFAGRTANGGGAAASADTLNLPTGVAVDAAGDLYLADTGNNRVLLFTQPSGTDTTADAVLGQLDFAGVLCEPWNDPNGALSLVCSPNHVRLDSDGNLYVADTGNNRVLKLENPSADLAADQLFGQARFTSYALADPSATTLNHPWSMAVDSTGRLAVADTSNERVLIYSADRPPSATALSISPAAPKRNDALTGAYAYADPEGDAESGTEIRWYKNGAEVAAYRDLKKVPVNVVRKGETWLFKVRPRDGQEFGAEVTSPSVMVGNTAPVASAVTLGPSPLVSGSVVSVSWTYSDPDGDAQAVTRVRWTLDGAAQAAFNDQKTVSTPVQKGQLWAATVTPYDGTSYGTPVTASAQVENSPPAASALTVSPSAPVTFDALTAGYLFSDADPADVDVGSEVRWLKDGVDTGLVSLTVPAGTVRRGEKWSFSVRPFDGAGYGPTATSAEVTVGNAAPVASDLAIAPPFPRTDDPIVASWQYVDPENDAEGAPEIRWLRARGGAAATRVTALDGLRTVPAAETERGDVFYFTVRPRDGSAFGTRSSSPSVTVLNTAPRAEDASISPAQPFTDDELSALWTFSDPDLDAEDVAQTAVRWFKNGLEQPSLAGQRKVPKDATRRGEVWFFQVAPHDGLEAGLATVSTPVLVQNSPPVAAAGPDQSVRPQSVLTRVMLDGTASSDPDGDLLAYDWSEGGALLKSGPKVELDLPVGKHLVELKVTDPDRAVGLDVVEVTISDPTLTVDAGQAFESPPGWTSLSGSSLDDMHRTLSYQWSQIAGAPARLEGADTLTPRFFAAQAGVREFQLVATPEGGIGAVAAVEVTTTNLAPSAYLPRRTYASPGQAVTLDGSLSGDPNGDPLGYTFRVSQAPEGSEPALTATDTAKASFAAAVEGAFTVELVVDDGLLPGAPVLGEVVVFDPAKAHPPVAVTGPRQLAQVGDLVSLSGSESWDGDGDVLTFSWRLVSGPAEAALSHAATAQPSFTPKAAGDFVFALAVSDLTSTSAEQQVTVSVLDAAANRWPAARAGTDQVAQVADEVVLDGSRSSDADGDPLTYAWTQVRGPAVALREAATASPHLTPTAPGLLEFEVVVSDGKVSSLPSRVRLVVTEGANRPPSAAPGADTHVLVGTPSALDATASSDPDGDPLRFLWEQVGGPPAPLSDVNAAQPSLTPRGLGAHVFQLTAVDGQVASLPAEARLVASTHGADDQAPQAAVAAPLQANVGAQVALDGTGSSDPDPLDHLFYRWAFTGFPTGHEPVLDDPSAATPSFTPAAAGDYTVRLVVTDGELSSAPAFAHVRVLDPGANASGCGCGAGGASPLLGVALALLAPALLGRRRTATGLVLLALFASAAASAAPKTRARAAKLPPPAPSPVSAPAPAAAAAAPKPAEAAPPAAAATTTDVPRALPAASPDAEGPPNAYLAEAKELYANFQFEGIVAKLEFALAVKGVTLAQKLEAYKLMAFTHAAFDDGPKAEAAFLKLLELSPDYALAGASPKIRAYFAGAQKAWKMAQAVKLQHATPNASAAGATTSVDVAVSVGADRVKAMTLHYRPKAEAPEKPGAFSQMGMSVGETGVWSAPVPNVFPGATGRRMVEYFVRARGADGSLVAEIANETSPLEMEVDAVPPSRPVYKSPWFWGGVGVAVAAAVITPLVILSQPVEVQPGSLGKEQMK